MSYNRKHKDALLRQENKRNARREKKAASSSFQAAVTQALSEGYELIGNNRAQTLVTAVEYGYADYLALAIGVSKEKIRKMAEGSKNITGSKRDQLNKALDNFKNGDLDPELMQTVEIQRQISDAEIRLSKIASRHIPPQKAPEPEVGYDDDEDWEALARQLPANLIFAY